MRPGFSKQTVRGNIKDMVDSGSSHEEAVSASVASARKHAKQALAHLYKGGSIEDDEAGGGLPQDADMQDEYTKEQYLSDGGDVLDFSAKDDSDSDSGGPSVDPTEMLDMFGGMSDGGYAQYDNSPLDFSAKKPDASNKQQNTGSKGTTASGKTVPDSFANVGGNIWAGGDDMGSAVPKVNKGGKIKGMSDGGMMGSIMKLAPLALMALSDGGTVDPQGAKSLQDALPGGTDNYNPSGSFMDKLKAATGMDDKKKKMADGGVVSYAKALKKKRSY